MHPSASSAPAPAPPPVSLPFWMNERGQGENPELTVLQSHEFHSHLNRLVMDYLVVEGYKEAAQNFARESGMMTTSAAQEADFESIQNRMTIRQAIQQGNIVEAIERVNDLNPEVGLFSRLSASLHPHLCRPCPASCPTSLSLLPTPSSAIGKRTHTHTHKDYKHNAPLSAPFTPLSDRGEASGVCLLSKE